MITHVILIIMVLPLLSAVQDHIVITMAAVLLVSLVGHLQNAAKMKMVFCSSAKLQQINASRYHVPIMHANQIYASMTCAMAVLYRTDKLELIIVRQINTVIQVKIQVMEFAQRNVFLGLTIARAGKLATKIQVFVKRIHVSHLKIVVVLLVWTFIASLVRPQIDRVTHAQQIISALLD